ncbi:Multisubstrate pseudouridine synthase 7 [Colletotrichum orbiculare MAFF 240422]|uniref:Multisubstrate pseudouridine synthase 7 n=1 Tax=Colletotrichum orbiculare (strain 104-T / ATCC 96160 / CBS 514.97 / LARS 414 / MAFF 240422) TaxID=1213857 RepID=N4UQ63_COLOR|nr:Multisubstrate pseudouridine synthase 7 [Colletotrichum orbiculare MAFF 240422]
MATEVRRFNGTRLDASLGITERIAPTMISWTGDMRKRYTDFQVYEINKDGSVLHLEETRLPSPPKEPTPPPAPAPEEKKEEAVHKEEANTEQKTENGDAEKPAVPLISAEDVATLAALTNEEFANQLVAIYQTISVDKTAKPEPATSPVMGDKDKRGQLHQQVRRIFNSVIDTTTDPTGAIVAKVLPPRGKGQGVRGGRDNKPREKKVKAKAPGDGEYLHFTLYKENRDTMDATHQIAKALRIKPQLIGTAGTKDRRAATTQRCSIRHQRAEALIRANSRLRGVTTGDYLYSPNAIHLGAHAGNEFVIALKDCLVAENPNLPHEDRQKQIRESVTAAMASMHSRGWINYFGHQRFGTHDVGTHEVGRYILQEDFEGAVNAILAYDETIASRAAAGEIPSEGHQRDEFNRHHACMLFRNGGSSSDALNLLPRRFNAESSLIYHLGRPNTTSRRDFIGALTSITRGLRSMYLHAYQSFVWNHAASKRWQLYGDKVVEGDLVFTNASADEEDDNADARPLTAEEAASGKYTIHDIVLPSPGHSVAYPTNALGDFYAEFMREHGNLDPQKMMRRHREFSLPGTYRKFTLRFLAEPKFEVREYTDDNEQMHPTDMDLIRARNGGSRAEAEAEGSASKKRSREGQEENKDDGAVKKAKIEAGEGEDAKADVKMGDAPAQTEEKQGEEKQENTQTAEAQPKVAAEPEKKTAVVVTFQLPKSAYATVALRELMGVDESEVTAAPATAAAAVTTPAVVAEA